MILQGETISKAMTSIGYSPTTANDHPESLTQNLAFQNAKEELKNAVLKNGVSFDRLAKKVSDGLDASKTVRIYETGETETLPDHDAQIKWYDRAARALGIEDDKKGAGGVQVNILQLIREACKERGLEE